MELLCRLHPLSYYFQCVVSATRGTCMLIRLMFSRIDVCDNDNEKPMKNDFIALWSTIYLIFFIIQYMWMCIQVVIYTCHPRKTCFCAPQIKTQHTRFKIVERKVNVEIFSFRLKRHENNDYTSNHRFSFRRCLVYQNKDILKLSRQTGKKESMKDYNMIYTTFWFAKLLK